MADRGVDGLTPEELRRGRDAWWDERFSRALLDALPAGARRVVEVGCGLGRVAGELLPRVPELEYVGVDLDKIRVAQARAALAGPRAHFLVGRGEALPLAGGVADAVMTVMTLQHVRDPVAVLAEGARVARRGGAVVAAEPDNPSQRWYFDGLLYEITAAFGAIVDHVRKTRGPADLGMGPRVPSLMRAAGLGDVACRVHAVQALRFQPASAAATEWRRMLALFAGAGGLAADAPEVGACAAAIDDWLAATGAERIGYGGTAVPIFITRARA